MFKKNQCYEKKTTLSEKNDSPYFVTWVSLTPKICIYVIPHLHKNKISRENHPTDDWQSHSSSPSDHLSPEGNISGLHMEFIDCRSPQATQWNGLCQTHLVLIWLSFHIKIPSSNRASCFQSWYQIPSVKKISDLLLSLYHTGF